MIPKIHEASGQQGKQKAHQVKNDPHNQLRPSNVDSTFFKILFHLESPLPDFVVASV